MCTERGNMKRSTTGRCNKQNMMLYVTFERSQCIHHRAVTAKRKRKKEKKSRREEKDRREEKRSKMEKRRRRDRKGKEER
jgi:hypothetical protein